MSSEEFPYDKHKDMLTELVTLLGNDVEHIVDWKNQPYADKAWSDVTFNVCEYGIILMCGFRYLRENFDPLNNDAQCLNLIKHLDISISIRYINSLKMWSARKETVNDGTAWIDVINNNLNACICSVAIRYLEHKKEVDNALKQITG